MIDAVLVEKIILNVQSTTTMSQKATKELCLVKEKVKIFSTISAETFDTVDSTVNYHLLYISPSSIPSAFTSASTPISASVSSLVLPNNKPPLPMGNKLRSGKMTAPILSLNLNPIPTKS